MLRLVALLFLLAILGCSSIPQAESQKAEPKIIPVQPGEVTIKTDQTEYVAKYRETVYGQDVYEFKVTVQYENRTGVGVYLNRCYPNSPSPTYDLAPDNGNGIDYSLDNHYRPAWAGVGHNNHIFVRPGDIRTDQFTISGPTELSKNSTISKDKLNGRFRILYYVSFCRETYNCERPGINQWSNAFTVRVQ
jgi:hypothetical protein